jgi:hypothetical protein
VEKERPNSDRWQRTIPSQGPCLFGEGRWWRFCSRTPMDMEVDAHSCNRRPSWAGSLAACTRMKTQLILILFSVSVAFALQDPTAGPEEFGRSYALHDWSVEVAGVRMGYLEWHYPHRPGPHTTVRYFFGGPLGHIETKIGPVGVVCGALTLVLLITSAVIFTRRRHSHHAPSAASPS